MYFYLLFHEYNSYIITTIPCSSVSTRAFYCCVLWKLSFHCLQLLCLVICVTSGQFILKRKRYSKGKQMTNIDKSIDVTPRVLKMNKYFHVINMWRGLQIAYFKFEVFILGLRQITLGNTFCVLMIVLQIIVHI